MCEWVIQEAWNWSTPHGSLMFRLYEKIKNCRTSLLLEELTCRSIGDQVERIKIVKGEINRLLYQEEVSWRQQSRAIWLAVGDKKTKFFHQRARQWRRKNQIVGVFNDVGGVLKKMRLLKWQKITSKICLQQYTQIMQIWRLYSTQLTGVLQLTWNIFYYNLTLLVRLNEPSSRYIPQSHMGLMVSPLSASKNTGI